MRLSLVLGYVAVLSFAAGCGPSERGVEGHAPVGAADAPEPRTLTTIENEATVAIAVDDTHAYVTTHGNGGGSIVKVSLAGGGREVLASMNPGPFAIAIDDAFVYFSVRDTGRIHRVSKNGGAVAIVAEQDERANGAEAIALDATHVYWSAVGGIFRAPKTSTSAKPELIAEDDQGAAAIAVDGGEAFWIARGTADDSNGALYKVKTSGGERTTLGTGAIFMPTWGFSIAAKSRWVFVPDTKAGRIYRVERNTGELTLVSEGEDSPVAVAADDRRVYWSTGGTVGARSEWRTLGAAPLEGGPVERLVATRQANIYAIASNGHGVFFTDYTSTGSVFAAR